MPLDPLFETKEMRKLDHRLERMKVSTTLVPALVMWGGVVIMLTIALLLVFDFSRIYSISLISFCVSFTLALCVVAVLWQPPDQRLSVLGVIIGCLVMIMIVLITWKYVSSQLDIGWPAHSPHYRGS